jgi:hypothetical protein
MTLEIRINNLVKAMNDNRKKGIVKYKFRMYLTEYDNLEREPDVGEKIRHRELSLEYFRYMASSEESKKR